LPLYATQRKTVFPVALLGCDTAPGDPTRRIDPILTDLELTSSAWKRHEQMLCLRLPEAALTRLCDPEFRLRLVGRLEDLGFRYVALDLQPLAE